MEPTSIIVTALTTGLSISDDKANNEVKSSLRRLEKKIEKAVSDDTGAQIALELFIQNPDSRARQALLVEELDRINISEDAEAINLSQNVLKAVDQSYQNLASGKYNITVSGAQGLVIGDAAQVSQVFQSTSKSTET